MSVLRSRQVKFFPCCALIFSTVLLAGCTCNPHKQAQAPSDSLQHVQDALQADSLAMEGRGHQAFVFDSLTTRWLSSAMGGRKVDTEAFTSSQAPDLNPDSLAAETDTDAAIGPLGEETPFQPEPGYYTDYAKVLRWAPDSSFLLDFGSYGSIPIKGKDGKVRLEGGDPDTRVTVASPKDGKQWQILFGGPGLKILDAKWKDSHRFLLLYASSVDQHPDTLLIAGDMNSRRLHWYELNKQ